MSGGNGRRTKIERLLDVYDLEGWGERLESSWLGEHEERESLRELAAKFNVALLDARLQEAGETATQADLESTYRTLTGDDVARSDTVRKRRELQRAGIDVDDLLADFVTHQAVHTYLTRVRGADLDRDGGDDRVERKRETIQRLVGRTAAVTESGIEQLATAGVLTGGDYEALVTVSVVCSDCGTDYTVAELLDAGGCDCKQ